MASRTALLPRILSGASAALLPYLVVVIHRHLDFLYIAQLERYKSPRLWGWISRHWGIVLDGQAALVQMAVLSSGIALAWFHLPVMVFYIIWVVAGIWLRTHRSSLQVSQRLQFTPRAVRLAALTFTVSVMVVLATTMLTGAMLSRLTAVPWAFLLVMGLCAGLAVFAAILGRRGHRLGRARL